MFANSAIVVFGALRFKVKHIGSLFGKQCRPFVSLELDMKARHCSLV